MHGIERQIAFGLGHDRRPVQEHVVSRQSQEQQRQQGEDHRRRNARRRVVGERSGSFLDLRQGVIGRRDVQLPDELRDLEGQRVQHTIWRHGLRQRFDQPEAARDEEESEAEDHRSDHEHAGHGTDDRRRRRSQPAVHQAFEEGLQHEGDECAQKEPRRDRLRHPHEAQYRDEGQNLKCPSLNARAGHRGPAQPDRNS